MKVKCQFICCLRDKEKGGVPDKITTHDLPDTVGHAVTTNIKDTERLSEPGGYSVIWPI